MTRNHNLIPGATLLILALLAAPVALATAPTGTADCCDSDCGDTSADSSGCPLPCCHGLTCTVAKPALNQEPGEATPTGFVVVQDRVPLVFPRPIEHPPRT